MISIKVLARTVEKFTVDNSPIILTIVGVGGSVASAYLTGTATVKAVELVREEKTRIFRETPLTKYDSGEDVDLAKTEVVKLVWKEYIPAVGVLTVTVTSIIFANRINTRRAAAMAVAYSLSEKAYSEYREKVVEKFNANKERQVRDDIAQEHVTKNPPSDTQLIIVGSGDVLCYDLPNDRYFMSNMEKLRSVQNDINAQAIETGQACLSDLYAALKLKETLYSEELGWMSDDLLDMQFSAVLTDDQQPCISFNYYAKPLRGGALFRDDGGFREDPPF